MPTELVSGLFAGQDLAARVEHAERTLIEEGARAAARRDPQQRVLVRPIGGGLAVWAGPGSPLDKVVGVGMNGAAFDDAELDAVEQAFAEREAPVQIEVSTLADPAVVERLTRRGYVLFGFENVLGLRLEPGRRARPAEGIEIRDVGHEFETWVNVVVDGFATPDTQGVASHEEFPREAIEQAERDLTATNGFVGSLAMIDGKPVGGASLRLSDGIAQLCGAATLPEFRRRGVQGALLSMRLAAAAAAGCDLAVVTTLPGSKSQQNVQKLGFQLLYPRAILVR
ncbi:GNAT family N-acetyltransferase [Nocardia sp. CA-084685]|uniref:GNAT family N-acetyltransferase n=1 Tax=Nocardia sp. CA-084685 TaxID=3239970 RepID=UPI003D9758DA